MDHDLFSYPQSPGFQRHSATSRAAAKEATAAGAQAEAVLELLEAAGPAGLTTDEVRVALLAAGKIHENSVMSARMRGLELNNKVVKTKKTRTTKAGRQANVYVTAAVFARGGHEKDVVKAAPSAAQGFTAEQIEAARGAFYHEMRRQGYKTFDIAAIDDKRLVEVILAEVLK